MPSFLTNHYVNVESALACIKEKWPDLETLPPLGLDAGGTQAAFDADGAKTALSTPARQYKCGGNLFFHNVLHSPNYKTPINAGQLAEIKKFWFSDTQNARFPFELVVAVTPEEAETAEALKSALGRLERLSPEEPVHALVFAVQEAITRDDPNVDVFFKLMRTISFKFEVCDNGTARFWRASNIREEMVEHGLVVARSVRQRIYEIAGFKQELEGGTKTVGADKIAKLYEKQLQLAKSSEKVNFGFVDSAISVWKKLFMNTKANAIIQWLDENHFHDNPLSSVYQLQAIVDRTRNCDESQVAWVVEGLVDGFRADYIGKGDFAVGTLRDVKKSYNEVLVMKFKVRDHLLSKWLQELPTTEDIRSAVRRVFSSFEQVRSCWAPYDEKTPVDLTWCTGWPQHGQLLIQLLDDLLFGSTFDGRYKDSILK